MSNLYLTTSALRWDGEFLSPELEAAFLTEQGFSLSKELTRSLIFCAVAYFAFGLLEVFQALDFKQKISLVALRLSIVATALVGIFLCIRSSCKERTARRVATVFASFGMLSFLLVTYIKGEILLHGMSLTIIIIIIYLFIPNRVVIAALITVCGSIGFSTLAYLSHSVSVRDLSHMAMLLLLANAFGAAAARRNACSARRQYQTQQILLTQSIRDPLTGAFNRRHLNSGLLEREVNRTFRQGGSLSVIMCDLDHFKTINDTYGHEAGDIVLKNFASLLLSMTRDGIDTVVRFGGEEFLIILPDTTLSDASSIAERMRLAIATTSNTSGPIDIHATASFGVVNTHCSLGSNSVESGALISRADELMYVAKRNGRDRVEVAQFNEAKNNI